MPTEKTKKIKNGMSKELPVLQRCHEITRFAAKPEHGRHTLESVLYEAKDQSYVATDGRILMKVATAMEKREAFPDGLADDLTAPDRSYKIPKDAITGAVKEIPKNGDLPVLRQAVLGVVPDGNRPPEDWTIQIKSTDMNREVTRGCKDVDAFANYPDYSRVIPAEDPVGRVSLDVDYLKIIADYFSKHCPERPRSVILSVYDEVSPVVFESIVGSDAYVGHVAKCVLLPKRMTSDLSANESERQAIDNLRNWIAGRAGEDLRTTLKLLKRKISRMEKHYFGQHV